MMQEHMCLNCPARFLARHVETSRGDTARLLEASRGDMARLLEALGESAAAAEIRASAVAEAAEIRAAAVAEAAEIRAAGCAWWWTVTEDSDSGATRRRDVCGTQALPEFLTTFGARIVEATQQVGATKNEIASGLGRIAAAAERTAGAREFEATVLATPAGTMPALPPAEGPRE